MKKVLFIALWGFLTSFQAYSQLVTLSGADGRPIILEKRNDIDGSPFFLEEFLPSSIILNKESIERKTLGRINLLASTFEFKNNDELLEIPFTNIKSVTIENNEKGVVYNFQNSAKYKIPNRKLVLILFEGDNFELIKEFNYKLSDVQTDSYSQAEAKRKVMDGDDLFIFFNNSATNIKRSTKSFLSVLPSHLIKAADDYIKKNKLNLKTDHQIVQVLEYIDGLK